VAVAQERFLSTEEVAERLQVDEQTVRRWIKSGKLEAVKPGREWRIPPGAFEALLESYSSPKAPSHPSHAASDKMSDEERRMDSKPPVTVPVEPLELRGELAKADIALILKSVAAGEISVEAGVEEVWKRLAA
jgi:excisionase family DNA binding protein